MGPVLRSDDREDGLRPRLLDEERVIPTLQGERWWQERAVFIRTRPAADGLRRLADNVSRGSAVVRVRRLGGGLATATSLVTLRTTSGNRLDVVLKRFPNDRRSLAVQEWERLRFAQRVAVPSPEPIALDRRGKWFGVAAIVMTRLPGRPDVVPKDLRAWIEAFVETQVTIHATRMGRLPTAMRPREIVAQPVKDLPASVATEEAQRYVTRRFGRARTRDLVIGHGDAHPGNVLWSRGRISGVTDWQHAGVFPRGHEVAYARADIAVLAGPRAADSFLEAYERAAGVRVNDMAMWDLRQGLAAMRWSGLWALGYREQGSRLTARTARTRAAAFVEQTLASPR